MTGAERHQSPESAIRFLYRIGFGKRQRKRMATVRDPLMRVVHSRISEDEAIAEMRPIVRAYPDAAKGTLAYVQRASSGGGGFIAHRAERILLSAMGRPAPEPSENDRELLAREERLGWLPLNAAFDELSEAEPSLSALASRAAQLRARDDTCEDPPGFRQLQGEALDVVGPDGRAGDSLLRTNLAASVVVHHLAALAGRPGAADPSKPLWHAQAPSPPPAG